MRAPEIYPNILFMPPVTSGDPPVTEKTLRPVLPTLVWSEQRERWAKLRGAGWGGQAGDCAFDLTMVEGGAATQVARRRSP